MTMMMAECSRPCSNALVSLNTTDGTISSVLFTGPGGVIAPQPEIIYILSLPQPPLD